MIYWNKNEEAIIGRFIEIAYDNSQKNMILVWDDESMAVAKFDWFSEDENDYDLDEPEYEEFWSFDFFAKWIVKEPPIEITKDLYFIVNYHNFPELIYMEMEQATDMKATAEDFAGRIREMINKELVLFWNDGSMVIARYNSHDFEDTASLAAKNNDSVLIRFKAVRVIGVPPVDIDDNLCFAVSSRNFPDTIFEEIDRQSDKADSEEDT